ncbi:hypothetical protein CC86DRAFT_191763 [Ophiobolus disseminans]|uniref:Uncharacterized protein n=1 Tax=Ophiobolus disseminans TaxID=1469910 RepID=A0A6A7A6V0_9PLEO|nr:hypothetical protein CC86DRAFT_191763 [Ophiobolus disseminans]
MLQPLVALHLSFQRLLHNFSSSLACVCFLHARCTSGKMAKPEYSTEPHFGYSHRVDQRFGDLSLLSPDLLLQEVPRSRVSDEVLHPLQRLARPF